MLRLTTFGSLALSRDGVPTTGAAAQRSRLALLALLAESGPAGISRDKLLLYLWPESDSERARHALKQAVYALRRDLGADDAIVGTATLSLNAAVVTSDLWDFSQAVARGDDTAAAAAYTGPFLDGVYLKEAPEFERWTAEVRARLAHQWCSAVERLVARVEAAGEWREAIAWRRQLAAAEPLSGRVAIALMRALAESGDVGAALQQFRVHETLVKEELDAAPEPEITALAAVMRSGSWQRTAPVQRPITAPAPAPAKSVPAPAVVEAVAASAPLSVAAPPVPLLAHSSPSARAAPSRPKRRGLIALAATAMVFAVAATSYVRIPADERAIVIRFLTRSPARITPGLYVVAPLENMTGDTSLDMFGGLAAEAVTRALQRAHIEVVPAASALLAGEILDSMPAVLRPHARGLAVAREYGASTAVIGSYYPNRDTIRVSLQFIDMATGKEGPSFPPIDGVVKGTVGSMDLAEKVGQAMLAKMAQAADSSAEGRTVALVPANSYEAYGFVDRAYALFFSDPADTASVFALLNRARALDSTYTAPLLLRGYILDVKRLWPGTQEVVSRLRPLAPRLNGVEHSLLDLYESDLQGDPYGRLQAAREIMKASPGATDMALLYTLSALYVGKPEDALAVLKTADPDHGINLVSPVYWQWRAEAEHEAGQYAAEARTAEEGIKRFPRKAPPIQTMARVLATAGESRLGALNALLAAGVPDDTNPRLGRLDLMATAARELRHHGDSVAATAIFTQVAREESGLAPGASRLERHLVAAVLYDLGRYSEARALLTELSRTDPSDLVARGRLGAVAIRMSDTATAARTDRELAAITTPSLAIDATIWRAHLAAAGGRIDDAVALLRTAVRHGYRLMDLNPDTVHLDRDFVELSASKAYQDLKRELAAAAVP